MTGAEIDTIARAGDRAGDPPPPDAREGDEVVQISGASAVRRGMRS